MGDGDRLLGGDPVCDFQSGATQRILMNSGADRELAEAFVKWANAKMGVIQAEIRAEREYVSAAEGARRLCLAKRRQFIPLMKNWGIEPVYISQNRRRWIWNDIETALRKRELPSSQKLRIAA